MTVQSMILLGVKISIMLTVFALGTKATPADATFLLRRPRDLTRALLSMYVLMPVLALILDLTFNLNPAVKIALVALSVSPVPPIFPNTSFKSHGRDDYTFGLLVATPLLAIIVIPIAMGVFQWVSGFSLQMSARSVAGLVFTTILIPLLLGMALRTWALSLAERVAKPVGTFASILLLVCFLPVLIGSARTILSLFGDGTLLSMSVFALVGLAIGYFLGGPERENRSTLSLATATRHPGVAIAIAHTNFPQQKLVVPAVVLYLIVAGLLHAIASSWRARAGRTPTATRDRMAA